MPKKYEKSYILVTKIPKCNLFIYKSKKSLLIFSYAKSDYFFHQYQISHTPPAMISW